MAKITYTSKADNVTTELPEINKVTAANMNEVKASVNAVYDTLGGFAVYADTATAITPIPLSSGVWVDLTNDKLGANTLDTYKPSYVAGDLWNTATNSIKFSELGVGKALLVRNDFSVTTGSANTRLDARLYFPDTGKIVEFSHDNIATNGSNIRYSRSTLIYTTAETLTSGCKIQVKCDKSGSTLVVEDIVISVLSF